MSSPTADRLVGYPPGTPSYQVDLDSTDANLPQNTDPPLAESPTGLAAELRNVKAQTRQLSTQVGWINYLGLTNTAICPSPNAPIYDGASAGKAFSLQGDWTAIALLGRVIRATFSDGSQSVHVITKITVAGVSGISVLPATLNSNLVYVEFSAVGSPVNGQSSIPLTVVPIIEAGEVTGFALSQSSGGTGASVAQFAGDLDGTFPNATVIQLQGQLPINSAPPTTDTDQVMWWSGADLLLKRLGVLLKLAQALAGDTAGLKGTIAIPFVAEETGSQLFLKWVRMNPTAAGFTVPNNMIENLVTAGLLTYDTPFLTGSYFVIPISNSHYVTTRWVPAGPGGSASPEDPTEPAIGCVNHGTGPEETWITVVAIGQ